MPTPSHRRTQSKQMALAVFALLASHLFSVAAEAQKREPPVRQWWRNRFLATEVGKNHSLVKKAFRSTIKSANKATVRIYKGDDLVSLGTVVDPAGYIVTKSSEVKGTKVSVRIPGIGRHSATVVSSDQTNDLKMLKVDVGTIPYARLATKQPMVGTWIAAPGGMGADPLAVGVVSVAARPIEQQHGALGIIIDNSDQGPQVVEVIDGSAAKRAGIRADDVILEINSHQVNSREELIAFIKKMRPGDRARVKFRRDGDTRRVTATLSRRFDLFMGDDAGIQEDITGPLSVRRSGFLSAIQHDCLLNPNQCGGPLVDLKGNVIGINIARSDRVSTYALTAEVIRPWIEAVKAGTALTSL